MAMSKSKLRKSKREVKHLRTSWHCLSLAKGEPIPSSKKKFEESVRFAEVFSDALFLQVGTAEEPLRDVVRRVLEQPVLDHVLHTLKSHHSEYIGHVRSIQNMHICIFFFFVVDLLGLRVEELDALVVELLREVVEAGRQVRAFLLHLLVDLRPAAATRE